MRRREFLGTLTAPLLNGAEPADGWSTILPKILARIRAAQFPNRDFDVTSLGARPGGKTDCRAALLSALEACRKAGGGRVVLPAGDYLSNGPLHLPGNTNLHLAEGATLKFGTNPADYLPAVLTRWEGTRCHNYSPLIYAFRQENIAITGSGRIDGQTARGWADWKEQQAKDQNALREMGSRGEPLSKRVFGEGHFLRPSLFQPYDCRNVLVEGVSIEGSPFWTIHPVFCTNVTVRKVHVLPGTTNDDGADPDSCRDVLIEDCIFQTADDNIAIKAGRDRDAWGGRPCENIVIRRSNGVESNANGYCIGSEMSGDVRNVFIEDNQVGDVQSAFYIKSNSDRGGVVESVWVRRNQVEQCDNFIKLETDYKGVVGHPYPPRYTGFHFQELTCRVARKYGIYSVGLPVKPVTNLEFRDITVEKAGSALKLDSTRGATLRNVRINGKLIEA